MNLIEDEPKEGMIVSENGDIRWGRITLLAAISFALLAIMVGALGPGCKSYNRWQAREDAKNHVQVTRIEIQKAEEEAKVNRAQIKATEAEAAKRYQESIGLKRAQDEIRKTLTPLYVQHEYVEALEDVAHSQSNTIEFIPVGQNGIPIVGSTNITPGR